MARKGTSFTRIVSVLVRHGLARGLVDPVHLRLALEELGPTFVKIGQMLSGRPDLLPDEYIKELQKLQDKVRPEQFESICSTFESSVGKSLDDLFCKFDCSPLASGSIAQVHKAELRDGTPVVVKFRRAGVKETMLEGLAMLKKVATVAELSPAFQVFMPSEVINEMYRTTEQELDF